MRRGAGGSGRRTAVVVAAVVAAGFLPTLGSAGQKAASPHARAAALRAQRAAIARREHRAVLELYAAETSVSRAQSTLATLRARAAAVASEREVVRRRAAAVRRSLAAARKRLAHELRSLYEQGQPDPVAILLGATSIDQAAAGIDNLRRVARANRRLIADLKRRQATLRKLDVRLRARNRALAAAQRTVGAAAVQLELTAHDRSRTLGVLRTQNDLTTRQIASLDAVARQAQRRSVVLTSVRTTKRLATHPAARGTHTLVVDAVAYHLTGHTASGLPVGVGVVAVDPTVIPLGTRLFVPGYGRAVAADVGSAVRGNIIDLWMPSRAKARSWGRRTVTITIYG